MKRLTGSDLARLRRMVNLTQTYVAEHAAIAPWRLEEIECGEAVPTFFEVAAVFNVLRGARERRLKSHHDYCA